MKKIIISLLLLSPLLTVAQTELKIKINDPEPRVNQSVNLTIEIDLITEYLKNELGKDVEVNQSSRVFNSSTGFDKAITFKKAKKYTVGPFKFKFNDKEYTTNSVEINVVPELPMEEGVWLRFVEFDGQKYIILEQLIRNESDKVNTENGGYTHTIGGVKSEDSEFVELKKKLAEEIKVWNYNSESRTVNHKDAGLFDTGFSYSIKRYKINFEEGFKGTYVLSKKDFLNLPKKTRIKKIKLSNR